MIMKNGPKKMAAMILISKKPSYEDMKKSNEKMSQSVDDDSEGYKVAAEDIMKAIEDKDASALSEALQSFVSMCSDAEETSEEGAD